MPVAKLRVGDALAVATGDLRDVEVTTITRLTRLPAEPVYDIEVEGTHNFLANGIVAHNTAISGPAAPAPRRSDGPNVARLDWFTPSERASVEGLGVDADTLRPRGPAITNGFLDAGGGGAETPVPEPQRRDAAPSEPQGLAAERVPPETGAASPDKPTAAAGGVRLDESGLLVSDLAQRLAGVDEQVRSKQDELNAQFNAADSSSGEFKDRARALARIGRLAEIAEGLHNRYPALFDRYVTTVEPLWQYDVRTLNFILASSLGDSIEQLDRMLREAPEALIRMTIENASTSRDQWDAARNFFYLPGLPIVVESESLSATGRHTLEEAARLILASQWTEVTPHSLTHTEAIFAFEDPSQEYHGQTTDVTRIPMVNVHEESPVQVAATLVHEDRHLAQHVREEWDTLYTFHLGHLLEVQPIQHSWVLDPDQGPLTLLMEVDAYAAHTQFILTLWNALGFDPVTDRLIVARLFSHRHKAHSAIRILERRIQAAEMHPRAEEWLEELKELWRTLDANIQMRWEATLDAMLTSPDKGHRSFGFHAAAEGWQKDPSRQRPYFHRFLEALNRETDRQLLTYLVLSGDIPEQLVEHVVVRGDAVYGPDWLEEDATEGSGPAEPVSE